MKKVTSCIAPRGVVLTALFVLFILISRQINETNLTRTRSFFHRRNASDLFALATSVAGESGPDEVNVARTRMKNERPVRVKSYTCKTNISAALDSTGKPCFDIDHAALKRNMFAVNTSEASYVYCSIPKNGCTYHLGIMHRLLGFDYEGGEVVHSKSNKNRLIVSGEELRRMMLNPTTEKYMVVRNPLERVLSAYLDKVERVMPVHRRTPKAFEEWVYKELEPHMENRKIVDIHWKPQMKLCGFPLRDLWKHFRWFRVEEPVKYVDYLEDILPEWVTRDGWNGSRNCSLRESMLSPKARTGNTSERFYEYVRNVEMFDYLVAAYRVDIEGLGYEKEVADMRRVLIMRDN